ncbi:MAG: nicotinate-nucleotide adenylyltransferase [Dehalococcoidia bacterium]
MKTGLLGGTFDPIHLGHLAVAEDVRIKLGLDRVVFIPARDPWLKSDREVSAGVHRLEMVKMAIASEVHFEVSAIEMNRPGPTYTVDTLEELREDFGSEDELYFIAGADAVMDLPRWKAPERILALCRVVAVNRPGAPGIDVEVLKSLLPTVSGSLIVLDVRQVDISSTAIREAVRGGQAFEDMVPAGVADYIKEHGLYLS